MPPTKDYIQRNSFGMKANCTEFLRKTMEIFPDFKDAMF